jgi:hypothetical protein
VWESWRPVNPVHTTGRWTIEALAADPGLFVGRSSGTPAAFDDEA